MSRKSIVTHLINENRGLKKHVNRILKASLNNHTGMLYWKRKYKELSLRVGAVVEMQQADHDGLKEALNEERVQSNS
jgi:hypothetical protein